MTEFLSILMLCLAVYCYACAELQRQGQLRWTKKNEPFGFFGENSDKRKYKNYDKEQGPAFFLSTTLLVSLTDFYHHMQFWMFNFIALSITFALGWNLYLFIGLLFGIRIVHWSARKVFKK